MESEAASCSLWWYVAYAVAIWLAYRLLDYVYRLPRVGRYSERYIVVTGCDTGFGNAIARRLDSLGCHVFASVMTDDGEKQLRQACSDRLQTFRMDVTKPETVQQAVQLVNSKLPPNKGLWALLSNAGVCGAMGRCEWFTPEDYKATNSVNLYGMIEAVTGFLPLVKRSPGGRVVVVSSIAGRCCVELCMPYSVSKYAIEAFGDGLRRSMREFGIKVSLIEPGMHRTPMQMAIQPNMIRSWERTTPEVRQHFGEEYYKYIVGKEFNMYDLMTSPGISDVMEAYEHALLGRFPRARYVCGLDAIYVFRLLEKLPEWLSDILLGATHLDRPLPAFIKKLRAQR